ncbi:MAG: helix-turn-helix transcriptional regulator [Hyphomicrobiales bacterium]|nr:helix-turn-helix transcriptional regulator [Hyphomicrobiales bacterium]
MTPFGAKLRELRAARGASLKDMSAALDVSAAYLSALEHGKRGAPSWLLVQKIIAYFNVIWDEAEELRALALASDPRVKIETGGLSPEATAFANALAAAIRDLEREDFARLSDVLKAAAKRKASADLAEYRRNRPKGQA